MYIGKMANNKPSDAVVPSKTSRATQTNENDLCLCYIPEYDYNTPQDDVILHPKLTVNLNSLEHCEKREIVIRNFESLENSRWTKTKNAIKATSGFKRFKSKVKKSKDSNCYEVATDYNKNSPLQSGIYGKVLQPRPKRISVTTLARNNSENTSHVNAKLLQGKEVVLKEDYSFYDNYNAETLTLNSDIHSEYENFKNLKNSSKKHENEVLADYENGIAGNSRNGGKMLRKWSDESHLRQKKANRLDDSIENIDYMSITGYDEITSISTNGEFTRKVRVIDMQSNESLEFLKTSSDEDETDSFITKERKENPVSTAEKLKDQISDHSSHSKNRKEKEKKTRKSRRDRSRSLSRSEEDLSRNEETYRAFAVVPISKNKSESNLKNMAYADVKNNRLKRNDAVDIKTYEDEGKEDDLISASAKVARSLSFLLRNSLHEETLGNGVAGTLGNGVAGIQLTEEFDKQTYV